MLYRNDTFKDSIIYKENPRYNKHIGQFKPFRLNLKAGKYLLVALKDLNNNNGLTNKERLGLSIFYYRSNDTVYELELFKKHSRLKLLTNSTSEIGC
jgi:hypothetical protein